MCLLVHLVQHTVQVQFSLLIFCPGDVSVVESGVLKFIIVAILSVSPFGSVNICLTYLVLQCWVHIYLQLLHPLDELTPLSLYDDLCLLLQFLG